MYLFQEFSPHQDGKVVLLSIKPKYADLILTGSKQVEFRRSWAAQDVGLIVLYSSSPIQKIVGIVEVDSVVMSSPSSLWKTCTEKGGGLTRRELRSYFAGKSKGFAVHLGKVFEPSAHIDPAEVFYGFVPPQSFRYLDSDEFTKIENLMTIRKN